MSLKPKAFPLLRLACADKHYPSLRRAYLEVINAQTRDFAARVHDGAKAVSPSLRASWQVSLAKVLRPRAAAMLSHSWDLAGQEIGLHGKKKSTSKSYSIAGVAPLRPRMVSKADAGGVHIGDGPDDFLVKGDWKRIEEWVKTTAESASETSAKRLQNIFDRANEATTDKTGRANAGLTIRDIAESIIEEGLTQNLARAQMLAHTGAIWAYGEGAVERYMDAGVPAMRWLTTDDDLKCPFCAEMNNKMIEPGDTFFEAGDKFSVDDPDEHGKFISMKIPGGERGFDVRHPPLHPHCRCAIIPIVDARQLK